MSSATVCLLLAMLLHLSDAVTVQLTAGQPGTIPCEITGTYSFPEWLKDAAVTISNIGSPLIHPDYRERFSIDQMDNRSLSISKVQPDDKGSYLCTHNVGTNSPQTTLVTVKDDETNKTNDEEIQTANCIFFVPAVVVVTVEIIICCHILINAYKERKHNENKMEDKQNENKKKKKIKVVVILTIVEVLLFITVSVWFIVIQATVEDFEKLTKNERIATIILLVVEIVVFVQGVVAIFMFWKNRGCWELCPCSPDYLTCNQCGGVKKPPCPGGDRPTAAIKPTAEINPDPRKQRSVMKPDVKPKSGDTGQHHPDVSPQHRPQPALPPKERHGSDLSSVSRKDVKLDPIPPIRKNNSTTEFHMDNPESERSNIKVSSRGLSAVFDQEYDQPPTNRLAPIDHTVRDEPVRRKKKKKKTRTNNDNVKFDNDYD